MDAAHSSYRFYPADSYRKSFSQREVTKLLGKLLMRLLVKDRNFNFRTADQPTFYSSTE